MIFEPDQVAHELSKRGKDWSDKDSAFRALDEATKSVLSECIADQNEDKSHAAKETSARTAPKYREHLTAVAEARRAANRARVDYDTYRVWIDLKKEEQWNRRAEMKLT